MERNIESVQSHCTTEPAIFKIFKTVKILKILKLLKIFKILGVFSFILNCCNIKIRNESVTNTLIVYILCSPSSQLLLISIGCKPAKVTNRAVVCGIKLYHFRRYQSNLFVDILS